MSEQMNTKSRITARQCKISPAKPTFLILPFFLKADVMSREIGMTMNRTATIARRLRGIDQSQIRPGGDRKLRMPAMLAESNAAIYNGRETWVTTLAIGTWVARLSSFNSSVKNEINGKEELELTECIRMER
jgi:hypothetical protein